MFVNPDRSFPQKLREARENRGLTQEQVARVLGVSQELIALWEKGDRVPSSLHFGQLARLYGVKSESFFGDKPLEYTEWHRLLFREEEGGSLSPEATLELQEWLEFLDDYADFLKEEGGEPYLKGVPRELKLPERPLTDVRQASTQALRVREYYNLGQDAVPELYTFLDEQRILVYKGHLPAESGIWGAFYRHPQLGFSVFINVNATPGRQAFTLAHELAHALYHYHLCGIVCRREGLSPEEVEVERFANAWAAHFLVPGKALKDQAKRLGELSPETALLLANHFRVSYTFILFRLRNEGLIGKEELETWSKYRLEDLALRAGVPYETFQLPTPTSQYPDLGRYPPSVLLKIRKAVEEERLSVSGAAGLLRVDSTTVERELLADPREEKNLEAEEFEGELDFVSPGRKTYVRRG
jgi:Zn-dependent peptidase ImmA (M78 family)/DNA-binding XRE family transcriptional regulator